MPVISHHNDCRHVLIHPPPGFEHLLPLIRPAAGHHNLMPVAPDQAPPTDASRSATCATTVGKRVVRHPPPGFEHLLPRVRSSSLPAAGHHQLTAAGQNLPVAPRHLPAAGHHQLTAAGRNLPVAPRHHLPAPVATCRSPPADRPRSPPARSPSPPADRPRSPHPPLVPDQQVPVPDPVPPPVPNEPDQQVPAEPVNLPDGPDLQAETYALLQRFGIEEPTKSQVRELIPLVEIKEQVACISTKEKKELFRQRSVRKRHGQASSIGRAIRLCRNNVYPGRNPKKVTTRRRMAQAKRQAIDEFLRRGDNSFVLPDKKYYKKDLGRSVVALCDSLRNLHRKFVVETEVTVSFATFCKARDKGTVKTSALLKRQVCLCRTHANMKLMLSVVPGLPNSTTEFYKLTDAEIREGLESLPYELINFKMWTKDERLYQGRKVYHTVLRKLRVSCDNFKFKLMADLDDFRAHQDRVVSQYEAIRLLKDTLPVDHVVVQMDYAENWATSFMEEIQSAFFGKDQITLHPMVSHRRNSDNELVTQSFVGVSLTTNHSFPTTLAFMDQLVEKFREEMPELKHIHIVTDSPSSQYRNRYSCDLLAKAMERYNLRISWNWLEAGHGKGPCDGVGGALKGLADRIVKKSGSIQTAEEFVEQVTPQTEKIQLLLVTPEQLKESTEVVKAWMSPPVHNITTYHQATVFEEKLHLRKTSCYEACCLTDDLRPGCPGWVLPKARPPPNKRVPPKKKARTAPLPDTESDSDTDSDISWASDTEVREDRCGANQPGFVEEEFSSDEEGFSFESFFDDKKRRADRLKRRLSRQNAINKAQGKAAPVDEPPHGEAAAPVDEPPQASTPPLTSRRTARQPPPLTSRRTARQLPPLTSRRTARQLPPL